MKNIIRVVFSIFIIFLICGCSKDYKKLSYTTYNEYFSNKKGYSMIDKTTNFGINVRKCIEAGNGKVQIFYMEFENSDEAKKYVEDNYNKKGGYKSKNEFSYVKSNKGKYFRLHRVNNIVIYGLTTDKKSKKEVKEILKDLGY